MIASLGVHWIFDGVAAPELLADEDRLRRALIEIPDALGMTRVSPPQCFAHLDDAQPSLAGIVLIAESHFSLHLFPQSGVVHGDLFSCRAFAIDTARSHLRELYDIRELHEQVLERSTTGDARLDAAGTRR
jgi:S-adenosylmethionine/arginine decarboxylase-like enzyme